MLSPVFTENGWIASKIPYIEATFVFIICIYVLETYLDIRQHNKLKDKDFPKALEIAIRNIDDNNNNNESKMSNKGEKDVNEKSNDINTANLVTKTKEKYDKSRAYGLDRSSFGLIVSFWSILESCILLYLGYMPFVWSLSGKTISSYGYNEKNEIIQALVFITFIFIRDTIFSLSIPIELYSIFIIEERHGFNKQTLSLYLIDKIKSILLAAIFGYPLIALIIYIIQWGGEYFYIYLWCFIFVFTLIMTTIAPIIIMPLFNKFTPLEEGELREKIENLSKKLNFPLKKLFVCDGSKRSSHSNAYFYGFFNSKRIVLYDTLLNQANNDEIVAIIGHELGHWKLWHTAQGLIITQVYLLVAFFLFGKCMNDLDMYTSFGFSAQHKPTVIGLLLFFQTIWAPIDKILSFLVTYNTRRNEFQADAFAVKLGYPSALQSGLTKISIENLSNMNPDKLYSTYHYSHPPLVERLNAITESMKKYK